MLYKIQPLEVDPGEPFGSDALEREPEIKNITRIVREINSPLTLAISAEWGTGKTTFIKMWQAYLQQEDVPSIYFNAWETDFSADPLLAFLGELNEPLSELAGDSGAAKEAWEKTKTIGKHVAKRGLPLLIKALTVNALDIDAEMEAAAASLGEGITGDVLEEYLGQRDNIDKFKSSIASVLQESENEEPLVILVDELDRCRPDYAVLLLERIKHLFDIEGIVFILAVDRHQLAQSVKALYGQGLDAEGYLRRFIDLEYRPRKPAMDKYLKVVMRNLGMPEKLKERARKHHMFRPDAENLYQAILELAIVHDFSLRTLEQMVMRINLSLCSLRGTQYLHPILLTFLTITREFNRDLYNDYCSKGGGTETMISYLHDLFPLPGRWENRICAGIEGQLISAKSDDLRQDPLLDSLRNIQGSDTASDQESQYCRIAISFAESSTEFQDPIHLTSIIELVDLASNFQIPETQE